MVGDLLLAEYYAAGRNFRLDAVAVHDLAHIVLLGVLFHRDHPPLLMMGIFPVIGMLDDDRIGPCLSFNDLVTVCASIV
jgi:hypothetical protein